MTNSKNVPRISFIQSILNSISADSGNPGHGSNPPPPSPPPKPVSNAPLKSGIYLCPWTETPVTISALYDLLPGVVRINYPAFPLMTSNVNAQEAQRLVELIEKDISSCLSIGALPLIVTTLGTVAPATTTNVYQSAGVVADYYAGVAQRFPGLAWEIGNEAEIPSGGKDSALTAGQYAYTFNKQANAIRAVDKTAKIVTAGTSGFHTSWIVSVLTLTNPDAIGVHPYGADPKNYASLVAEIGTKIPVWFTEYGSQYVGNQEFDLRDYFAYARGVVPVAVWFSLSDLSSEKAQYFGLMDAKGNKRPSYAAAKTAFKIIK